MSFKYSRPLTSTETHRIRRRLLRWGRENGRDFPWRGPKTSAYEMLVAEMLLRKTRADSVASIYGNFLFEYATVRDLATASISSLEELIRPLGLFRIRARALRAMAVQILEQYDGEVPQGQQAIRSLPHCGRYIANAVLCFHFGEDRPVVDRGVERLLCRHFGFEGVTELHKANEMWDFMGRLLPPGRAREFNYALLDYCAFVCTTSEDRCGGDIGEEVD